MTALGIYFILALAVGSLYAHNKTFECPELLNHIAVHRDDGWVILGAVNRLYQLTSDLDIIMTYETGPLMDSPECDIHDCPVDAHIEQVDTYNKILIIDYVNPKIMECGSTRQGVCIFHDSNNLKDANMFAPEPVASNSKDASTVAFIAPGPASETPALYVAITHTQSKPHRMYIPSVCTRSMDNNTLLYIASKAITTETAIYVNSIARESYRINYIYGFASDLFSYFLTTQKNSTLPPAWYESRIVRICQKDPYYYSYTEIPVTCTGNDGTVYNLVTAATVVTPSRTLADSFFINPEEQLLFATFAKSITTRYADSDKPSNKSALCAYSLKTINRKIVNNIQTCYKGVGFRGLEFIIPDRECVKTKIENIPDDFCGLDVNTPLGGQTPVRAVAVMQSNGTLLTAVAANVVGNDTLVYLGTNTGHIKKVLIEKYNTMAKELEEIVVDEGSPVNKDLFFDHKREHLLVMTEHKLNKIQV